jgi:hypothetical protein
MSKSRFKSQALSGHRVFLTFEKIADTHWTEAEKLRALVAELDRLGVPDDTNLRLRYWPDDDNEMFVGGWTLGLVVPDAAGGAS